MSVVSECRRGIVTLPNGNAVNVGSIEAVAVQRCHAIGEDSRLVVHLRSGHFVTCDLASAAEAIDARDRVVALWVEARGRKAETAA